MSTNSNNEIKQILLSFRSIFYSLGIFSFIMNFLMLAPTFYMLQVYDRVLPSRNEMTLVMLSIILIFLFLVYAILEYVRSLIVIRMGNEFELQLNESVYTSAFKANLNQVNLNPGQAITDLTTLRQFLTGSTLFVILDAPWFPINLVIIFLFNLKVGVFALVGTLILVILAYCNEKFSKQDLSTASRQFVAANHLVINNLRNAEVIEALGMLHNLRNRWRSWHLGYLALQAKASERASLIGSLTKFTRGVFQSLILGFGAYLALTNELSAGMVIAGSILMGRVMSPVEGIIGAWKQLDSMRNAYQRLNLLLNAFPKSIDRMALPSPTGRLTLEQVTSGPPGSKIATIKNISLELNPGEVLGVLGASGSGKSSLAKLMVGVWPAAVGKVRLDSADLFNWDKGKLGKFLGYLPQDVELFSGTVCENIARFGEVDAEKVVRASKLTGLHDFILHLPQGYDTVIADGGQNLSGGQRQRIGLARSVYDDPCLIVLDEPNSNADQAGELALVELIKGLQKSQKTIVIITHRTQIVSLTTKLLLLHDGITQLYGSTEEVLSRLKDNAQTTHQIQTQANI